MTDFRKLKVSQKAHLLAMDVHRVAGQIRGANHAWLRSQMTRAAMSVPTNIVEGSGQQSTREYARFLRIALNSTTELEYHVITARDLTAVRPSDSLTLISQAIEVRKMLYGLLRYLASRAESSGDPRSQATTNLDCLPNLASRIYASVISHLCSSTLTSRCHSFRATSIISDDVRRIIRSLNPSNACSTTSPASAQSSDSRVAV